MIKPDTQPIFPAAFKYSIPVLFGYIAIGGGFGLLMADTGYPWWLSIAMGFFMYAGAGQYIAAGLFAAGTGLLEAALIQFVVNARHIAYSMSMMNRYKNAGLYKFYLIYGLTDETFALLSSVESNAFLINENNRNKFMFYVTILNQGYWITGTVIGIAAGSLIPFNIEGIGFVLTAMFVVLMVDKMKTSFKQSKGDSRLMLNHLSIFAISALSAVLCAIFLPVRISLLAAIFVSLILSAITANRKQEKETGEKSVQ